MGFGVWVWGLGIGVWGLRFGDWELGIGVGVWGLGLGFGVYMLVFVVLVSIMPSKAPRECRVLQTWW